MRNNKIGPVKVIALVSFFSYMLFFTSTIQAQQVSLSISPPLFELIAKPGKSVAFPYKLENLGDPVFINLKVLPFETKDNLGNIRIKPKLEGPILFGIDNPKMQLERPFFLKTNESQQILLRVTIPKNITDGDFYYTLLAETSPPTTTEGVVSVRAKASIGSNILITISNSGNLNIEPRTTIFSTLGGITIGHWKIFDSTDKIPLVFIIENKGKNMIRPEGQIILKGPFGDTAKYDVISKNVLAESQRLVEATPSAGINCENDHKNQLCLTRPSLILSGFFIGKYSLSTQIDFGENSLKVFSSTSFYAFPFKIIAVALITILIIVIVIRKSKDDEEE